MDLGFKDSELRGDPIKKAQIQTQIQEDYTRVDVYFQTLNVKSIVQSPTYPVSILLSALILWLKTSNFSPYFYHHSPEKKSQKAPSKIYRMILWKNNVSKANLNDNFISHSTKLFQRSRLFVPHPVKLPDVSQKWKSENLHSGSPSDPLSPWGEANLSSVHYNM